MHEQGALTYRSNEDGRTDQNRQSTRPSGWVFQLLRYVDDVAILVSSPSRMARIWVAAAEDQRWRTHPRNQWPSFGMSLQRPTSSPPYADGSTTAGSDESEGSGSERDQGGDADQERARSTL